MIPARMGSQRFPGKPLCDLLGKPMVQWVYEAAQESGLTDHIVVATPDREIVEACEGFGGEAILTSHQHPTGTDRIAEVAEKIEADFYVNVQGDEPLISSATIQAVGEPMLRDASVEMASVYGDCEPGEEDNSNVVKVVTDLNDWALYFSRHAIPFPRGERSEPLKKHIGLYAYRRDALMRYPSWPQTPLEKAESLEQLRFMENGVRIRMNRGEPTAVAVDTPEQAEEVRKLLSGRA